MVETQISLCILFLVSIIIFTKSQELANKKCVEFIKNSVFRTTRRTSPKGPPILGVVGGIESAEDEFPHMVALGYGNRINFDWSCGGSLISENFVLSAAHCTQHRDLGPVRMIKLGTRTVRSSSGKTIAVTKTIRHPNYRPPSQYNDIALLKLQSPVTFSKSIFPACLNTVFDVRPRTNKLTATGWGRLDFAGPIADNLMAVDLHLYTHQDCFERYTNVNKRKLPDGIKDDTQLCAGGGQDEAKDTCQGDSGGPLVMKVQRFYAVVGITSFGKACGIENSPGVYTRVSAFIPWIEKNVWPNE